MSDKQKAYLFLGPSGCGKDTQVDKLIESYDFVKIGTGAIFRELFSKGDELGLVAHQYWAKGLWVPDDITFNVLDSWFSNNKELYIGRTIIFVSVVRTFGQIPLFDNFLDNNGFKLNSVVHFDLTMEEAVKRLANRRVCKVCGENYHLIFKPPKIEGICDKDGGLLYQREDDKPEEIGKRLNAYTETINPILSEYENRGKLLRVDATDAIEIVYNNLLQKMNL